MSSSASAVNSNPADLLPFSQKPLDPSSLVPPLAGPSQQQQQQQQQHLSQQQQQHHHQQQQQQQHQQQVLQQQQQVQQQQQQNQQVQQQQQQSHLPPPQQQPTPPTTTASQTPASTQGAHKRTYQACIPCRLRKVRCDLGSVEAPHDPPCVRCRRESKDCYFSATRRKSRVGNLSPASTRGRGASLLARGAGVRRASDVDSINDPTYDGIDSDSASVVTPSSSTISYGGVRKRQRIDSSASSESVSGPQETATASTVHGYNYPPAREYDDSKLRSPHNQSTNSHFDRNHEDAQTNTTASTLLQREVYNSHDALQLLFEAVGASTPVATSVHHDGSEGKTNSVDGGNDRRGSRADSEPRIIFPGDHEHHPGADSIMGPSPRRQFLHQIHRNSPLSPMAARDGQMRHPTGGLPKLAEHASLMGRAATTTSSDTRGTDMDRAIKAWGNSQFVRDGWFTAREAIDYVHYFNTKMQTLSPILSSPPELAEHPELLNSEPFLMTTIITIASRYKPLVGQGGASRSMYIHEMLWKELKRGFERLLWGGAPAPVSPDRGAATDRGAKGLRTMGTVEALIVLTEWHVRSAHFPMELGGDTWGILRHANDDDSGRRASMFGSRNGEKIGDMLEPVRRSDTMSWMLLGNALSLSYELGVFDEDTRSQEEDAPYRYQCKRLQRKLLVYIMQLASRLGFTPMVPMEICNLESFSHLKNGTPTWSTVGEMNDVVYDYWAELSLLMKKGASLLFPSRSATKEIIRQGKYNSLLRSCLPEMRDWKDRFERLGLPSPIHNILTLEYEHVRIFHNSLALQAVVERCTSSATAGNPKQPPSHSFAALMQMYSGDVEFINELVDAARCMLTTVVEKMMPGDELRHAPVRIYLRILSAAMFLLKTFALGAKEDDITVSLELMHNTTEALRAAAVDDVHLAWRFADLLETLTKRIQRRFVRMHRNGVETPLHGNGTHTPQPGTPMQHNQLHQQQHRMDLSKLLDGPVTSSMAPGGLHSIASPNGMHQQQYPMHYSQPGTPGSQGHHGPMDFFYSPNEPAFDDWLAIPIDPILDGGYGAGNGKEGMVYQNGLGIGVGLGVEVDGRGVDLLDVLLGMGEG